MRGVAKMNTRGGLDMGTQLGKRRRALLAIGEEFEASNLDNGSLGSYNICGTCGGTYGFDCHKFKFYKCGERGHVFHDFKKDQVCFHCHHPGHLKPDYPIWVADGVQAQASTILREVKVEGQEIAGVKF